MLVQAFPFDIGATDVEQLSKQGDEKGTQANPEQDDIEQGAPCTFAAESG